MKKLSTALCCALITLTTQAVGQTLLFDFEDQPLFSEVWVSGFSSTVSNYTLRGIGEIDAMKRPPTSPNVWMGGYVLLYGDTGTDSGSIILEDENGGEKWWFVVESFTAGADDDTTVVEGYLAGELKWQVEITTNRSESYKPVYTNATVGDMREIIDEIVFSHSTTDWESFLDDITLTISGPIPPPGIYNGEIDGWWTPHSVDAIMDAFNRKTYPLGETLYWWSDTNIAQTGTTIMHRPGLADFTINPDPRDTNDLTVGGIGTRGVILGDEIPELTTNESLYVDFDYRLIIGGDVDERYMDMFFSTTVATNLTGDSSYVGEAGDELGFFVSHTAGESTIAFSFEASEDPVLEIPAAGLGIDALTNGAYSDELIVEYTATRSAIQANYWICNIAVSNTAAATGFASGDVGITNEAMATQTSRLCISTRGDLSGGDDVSGSGRLGGYEIATIWASVLLAPTPNPPGYEGYLNSLWLVGDEPLTEPFEDFDGDGLLNIYEYAYDGDMVDPDDQGTLPQLVIVGDNATYSHVEVKAPDSGIIYTVEATDNLTNSFATPVWDATATTDHNAFYSMVKNDLSASDVHFFRTLVTTNAP